MDAPPASPSARLQAYLLGPVRLAVGNRMIPDHAWPRRSARTLLLLATPGHRLPRDRVLDLLWPDAPPDSALNNLRRALHALRRVLEPELRAGRESAYIGSKGGAVALRSGIGIWVDVDIFEAALVEVGLAPLAERPAMLREILALYGGDLLADELDADWPVARRERVRRAWRRAVLDLAELELGRCPLESVPVLEQLLSADSADEAAHRALMRARAACGRRDEALRQYALCVRAVREELDVEPDAETVAMAAEIRSAAQIPSAPRMSTVLARRVDNLPAPPTPLIGRGRELETLQDLLLDPNVHLVTVTGPGGIGKTRLALEAARQAADDVADGVCFVPLAATRDPQLVLPIVARTLEVDEVVGRPMVEVLGQALREQELLLVLDNLEQVIDVAAEIGTLLAACPRLTILATSREPLRVRAEHVVATPPLPVPPLGLHGSLAHSGAISVGRYEAVVLFADRARAAQPDFAVIDANASAVAALCARLDGLPLAIELVAARSRHLTPAELLALLARRLPLLTGGARDLPERQRTLWDAIAWSHDLLESAEQVLFRDSLVLWRALGDRPHTALVLANLGEALRAEGDLAEAIAVAREGLELSREVGDRRSAATALFILGSLIQHHEIDLRAADPLVEGLLLYQRVGDRLGMAWCLEALAGPAIASGRPELAAQFCGAAEVLREQVGVPLQPAERPAYHRHLDAARNVLPDPTAFHQAWATGRALGLDAVVALATELGSESLPAPGIWRDAEHTETAQA